MVMHEIDCFQIRVGARAALPVAEVGLCAHKTHICTSGTRTFEENESPAIAHERFPKGARLQDVLAHGDARD